MKGMLQWYFENATCGNREKCVDNYEATHNQLIVCQLLEDYSLLNIDMQLSLLNIK